MALALAQHAQGVAIDLLQTMSGRAGAIETASTAFNERGPLPESPDHRIHQDETFASSLPVPPSLQSCHRFTLPVAWGPQLFVCVLVSRVGNR
jgi:hypothetical protein